MMGTPTTCDSPRTEHRISNGEPRPVEGSTEQDEEYHVDDVKCRLDGDYMVIRRCTVLWAVWPPRTMKCNE
jgi:hypothetical protein